ncbi:MAG: chorismate mutase [Clostridiales Family XIII bacterium]|jgi:chorismate mutase/prephenate dehydratase|nr:chorismate mutase [Clostridiales Family XIII bacterium]
MNTKEQLNELRKRIDAIDGKMIPLFKERMEMSRRIAEIKGRGNLAITDELREQQVTEQAESLAEDEVQKGEIALLMRSVIAISKGRQRKTLFPSDRPFLPPPRKPLRGRVVCAFQGVPGAWSEQALAALFPQAEKLSVEFFEDLFVAVKEKRADYGVVAIENSQTGAIGETYDLLRKYGCYIVARTWIDIRHCLLAPEGVALSDIREVISHTEGFRQCAKFLRGKSWDLLDCRNTAVAAETAAASGKGRTAAIGSRRAAELNGLCVLVPDIMDAPENKTSFVVISPEPEYDAGDNLISLTFSTKHRSGALCEMLLPFMAGGMNLMQLESRPAGAGKYRFFAEVEGSILDEQVLSTLRHAASACEYFEVIGCYSLRG